MSARKKRIIEKKTSKIKLTDAVTSLNSAILKAKIQMDELSTELSKNYSKNEILSSLPLPFYSISEVTLKLNFAIQDIVSKELIVTIDSDSLEKLPQNTISQIEMKLTPKEIKSFNNEDGSSFISEN